MSTDRNKTLLKILEKKLGEGVVDTARNSNQFHGSFSTGLASLDDMLGMGYPYGKWIELAGEPSVGKSALSLLAIASWQKENPDKPVVLLDCENSYTVAYGDSFGVDSDNLLVVSGSTLDTAFLAVQTLLQNNEQTLFVLDSIAGSVTDAELAGELGPNMNKAQAKGKVIANAVRVLSNDISKTKSSIICINHLTNKTGVTFGDPRDTPGSEVVKFAYALRLWVTKPKSGMAISVKKDKLMGSRDKKLDKITYQDGEGFDVFSDLAITAINRGVLQRASSSSPITYNQAILGRGLDAAISSLKEDPDLFESINQALQNQETESESIHE